MVELQQKIEELLNPILARNGAFGVDLVIRNERGGKLIQAFVDTDRGITVEECAVISRELVRELEINSVLPGFYQVQVSSPGIDRPIRFLRQFHKNIGRRFRVKYREGNEPREMNGVLKTIEGTVLTFTSSAGEDVALAFEHITEAKEELPW